MYTCNGTNAQQWTVVEAGSTLQALGKCMDINGGGTADGTTVDLYTCNNTGAQVFIPQSNGELYNPQSNKCLDDTGYGGSGTQLQIWDCADTSNQQWTCLNPAGNSAPVPAQRGNGRVRPRLPIVEGRQGQPVPDLPGQAVELRPAAVGLVLLGVEQTDPQPCRPGILYLLLGPLPPGRLLVIDDEIRTLGNGGGIAWRPGGRPDSRREADDGRLGLGDNAVPVMHDQRSAIV